MRFGVTIRAQNDALCHLCFESLAGPFFSDGAVDAINLLTGITVVELKTCRMFLATNGTTLRLDRIDALSDTGACPFLAFPFLETVMVDVFPACIRHRFDCPVSPGLVTDAAALPLRKLLTCAGMRSQRTATSLRSLLSP